MIRVTAYIILVSLFTACTDASSYEVPKISVTDTPKAGKGVPFPGSRPIQHIMVSIDKDQQIYIGTQKIDSSKLDSLLTLEIQKFRAKVDTPTVVINADTTAWYGTVFRVMRTAKKSGARVVANVSD